MNDKGLQVTQHETTWLAPVTSVNNMIGVYNQMTDFVKAALKEDVDYGMIPGTSKNTLYKPGGEKLARFFGLSPSFHDLDITEDWTGADHDDEPFFYYRQECMLMRNGVLMASAQGSCNSWEKKYRYRSAKKVCPTCKTENIIKGKEEYGGGWICWKKNGGCGAKFRDGDKAIEGQKTGQVKNPDVHDLVNTILKMAQKRAFVAAVLLAVNGSEFFTQDMDDLSFGDGSRIIDVEPTDPDPEPERKPKVTRETAQTEVTAEKPNGNGQAVFASAIIKALVDDGAKTGQSAVGRLRLSNLDPATVTKEQTLAWHELYESWRGGKGLEAGDAAKRANAGEKWQPEVGE